MHRSIGYLSKRFVQVRPDEGYRVVLTFLYFFLVITAYYLIKPVSRSLVLGWGSRMVPYMDLVCAIVMGPIVTLFARCVDRIEKPRLVSYAFWTIISVILGFWVLLSQPHAWVTGAFYVWVSICSVLMVTLFWLVANDLYRPREAKRLFGLVGSGGILGGMVGSGIAASWAHLVGTRHLLLISAGVLMICWLIVQRLWALAPDHAADLATPHPSTHTWFSSVKGFVALLLHSRYLRLLVILVGINKLVATLVYYQLNPFIEHAFPAMDQRTQFIGRYLVWMNFVAFVIQFFLTSWVLRRWGLSRALLVLPCGLLIGTSCLSLIPALGVAAVTELFDGSLNYSLQQTTKEVLYLPIDRSIRYKIKPFIDMVVFRFGKGIAAILGIVLLDQLGVSARALNIVIIPLLVIWLCVAVWLSRDYVVTIRTVLQARAAAKRRATSTVAQGPAPSTGPATESLALLMDTYHTGVKLHLIEQLAASTTLAGSPGRELIAELTAYETFIGQTVDLDGECAKLKAVSFNRQESMGRRREAIRRLVRFVNQATVDHLWGIVMAEGDATVRQEAVRGLVRLRLRDSKLEFLPQPIRRQIALEVATVQRIVHVSQVCRQHTREPVPADDPLQALLRLLAEESLEQVFRLLMLLYAPEDIHLIYDQLQATDRYLRTDALELLDNLVDPAMRVLLEPVLDEDRFLGALDEPTAPIAEATTAYRLLQEAIWDQHCWLSVTTLCAVGRLRLITMRPELEKASQIAAPIGSAARVALELSA